MQPHRTISTDACFRRGLARRILACALAGLTLVAAGCSPPIVEPARHLVLITLDTTRFDRLGCYGHPDAGTPNIDGLAATGTRFVRAYAQTPLTLPSHFSILSGLNPPRSGIHVNGDTEVADGAVTLAERLSAEGFYTAASVGGFPLSSEFPVSRGFEAFDDRFVDPRNPAGVERDAGLVVRAARGQLDRHDGRRVFLWVHFFDPHAPYEAPAPFRERFPEDPYQAEIARVDAAIGELLKGLAEAIPIEQTLIALVADHGESLGDHGEPTHGFFLYDPTVRVPLVFSGAGGVPRGVELPGPVSTVDIAPTLLAMLGFEPPEGLDGSVLSLDAGTIHGEPIYLETELPARQYGWSALRGVVDGWAKYIDAPRPELYDLRKDPNESFDESGNRAELAGELRAWLDEVGGGAPASGASANGKTPAADPRLMSLGYVGTGSTGGDGSIDPKDRLDTYVRFQEASRALELGEPQRALPLLEALLAEEETVGARFQLAVALRMTGRLDEARATLEQLRERDAAYPGIDLEAARVAAARGDAAGMLRFADAHLRVFPSHPEALMFRGAAREMLGDRRAAEADYVAALEVNPAYGSASLRLSALLVRAGRVEEARDTLRTHLRLHPEDELARGLLGAL